MGTEALKREIDEQTIKLGALLRQREGVDRQIAILKVRLEALQEAFSLVNGPTANKPTIVLSDPWEDALRVVRENGGSFTTGAIFDEAKSRGSDIDRTRARTRLAHLVDRGKLRRVREGVFEFP